MLGLTREQMVDVLVGDHRRQCRDCEHTEHEVRLAAMATALSVQADRVMRLARFHDPEAVERVGEDEVRRVAKELLLQGDGDSPVPDVFRKAFEQ